MQPDQLAERLRRIIDLDTIRTVRGQDETVASLRARVRAAERELAIADDARQAHLARLFIADDARQAHLARLFNDLLAVAVASDDSDEVNLWIRANRAVVQDGARLVLVPDVTAKRVTPRLITDSGPTVEIRYCP